MCGLYFYFCLLNNTLLFADNDNRINRILGPVHLSILGSSSRGKHGSAEPRHVYISPTCLTYSGVQRQGPNILYINFISWRDSALLINTHTRARTHARTHTQRNICIKNLSSRVLLTMKSTARFQWRKWEWLYIVLFLHYNFINWYKLFCLFYFLFKKEIYTPSFIFTILNIKIENWQKL